MSSVARTRFVLGLIFAALIGVCVLLLATRGPAGRTGDEKGNGGAALAASVASFSIEGNATELISPGVRAPLNLKLTNPNNVAVSVTHLTVAVRKVTAPNADKARPCTIGDFIVLLASGHVAISLPPRATSTLGDLGLLRAAWPQVGMLDRAVDQDGCKGASLSLGYAASGKPTQR
jgi:hypothetical protein